MLNLCHRIGQEGKVPHTRSRLRAGSPEQVTGSIVYRVELAQGPQCPMRLRRGLEVTASGRLRSFDAMQRQRQTSFAHYADKIPTVRTRWQLARSGVRRRIGYGDWIFVALVISALASTTPTVPLVPE